MGKDSGPPAKRAREEPAASAPSGGGRKGSSGPPKGLTRVPNAGGGDCFPLAMAQAINEGCLLYTSDAADDM
eukprot:8246665-Alexandrium_andersonii.AAC.1